MCQIPPVTRPKKPVDSIDCDWPKRDIEALRSRLLEAPARWEEIAEATCLGVRYLRAFASGQVYCPPYDRFVLIRTALIEGAPARQRKAGQPKA